MTQTEQDTERLREKAQIRQKILNCGVLLSPKELEVLMHLIKTERAAAAVYELEHMLKMSDYPIAEYLVERLAALKAPQEGTTDGTTT